VPVGLDAKSAVKLSDEFAGAGFNETSAWLDR
jgi:hypothetical protein